MNPELKSLYDKDRYRKIKDDKWKFNMVYPSKFSFLQKDILIGSMLGDGHLYLYKNAKNSGLVIERSAQDLGYLEYEFNIFKEFCSSKKLYHRTIISKITGKKLEYYRFRTGTNELFTEFRNEWYHNSRIKSVPKTLDLNPTICAIWFCDDGSVVKYSKNRLKLQIATDGFSKDDCEFLTHLMTKRIGGTFHVYKKEDKHYIAASHLTTIKFIQYILPKIPHSMNRKIEKWDGCINDFIDSKTLLKHLALPKKLEKQILDLSNHNKESIEYVLLNLIKGNT